MEDLKAYIESGVLELYVLGDLTEDEKHEVEGMLDKHPELRAELLEIENALQKYAEKEAITPPENVRTKVLNAMDTHEAAQESPILPIPTSTRTSFYKYAFAASAALLLISLVALINLHTQLKESNHQIAVLQQSNERFSSRAFFVEKQLSEAKESLEIFHNPQEYTLVSLKGTPKAPEASMMVAFSPTNAEVMVDLASLKMPANDASHQYQLWALVNGKPVDLGVFDVKGNALGVVKMKSVKHAQAFAVTLEPKGGSVHPTMEQMMVMGTI